MSEIAQSFNRRYKITILDSSGKLRVFERWLPVFVNVRECFKCSKCIVKIFAIMSRSRRLNSRVFADSLAF